MSAEETPQLLPPEIEAHPPLEATCPHCGSELIMDLKDIYSHVTRHFALVGTPEARRRELMLYGERVECPGCGGKIDVTLTPYTSWGLNMAAPDPLEKYTPNSRYWERQKRGLPASNNLKL